MKDLYKNQREIDKEYFAGLKENTSLEYWGCALGGETGELLNILKKMARNRHQYLSLYYYVTSYLSPFDCSEEEDQMKALDTKYEALKQQVSEEAADVMIYLLILSDVLEFDLKTVTLAKQNKNKTREEIQIK